MDNNDFTNKYNTPLSSTQEKDFQGWMKSQSRDVSKDFFDYDLRGDWLQGAARDERGHGTDVFKKPNHPTFSEQSKYHGVDGNVGGVWSKKGSSWTFTPGETNLRNFSPEDLKDYFSKVEPGNQLILNGNSR